MLMMAVIGFGVMVPVADYWLMPLVAVKAW